MENNQEYANALEEKRKRYAKIEDSEFRIKYELLKNPRELVYDNCWYKDWLVGMWAIFFDACHIPYENEPEKAKCQIGDLFQFDFYLPWFKTYVKVVHTETSKEYLDYIQEKLEDVFDTLGNVGVMICTGEPREDCMKALAVRENDGGAGLEWLDVFFLRGRYGYRCDGNDDCSWESGHARVDLCSLEWNAHTKSYHTSDWSSDLYCPVDYKDAYARQNFYDAKQYVRSLCVPGKEIPTKEMLQSTKMHLW